MAIRTKIDFTHGRVFEGSLGWEVGTNVPHAYPWLSEKLSQCAQYGGEVLLDYEPDAMGRLAPDPLQHAYCDAYSALDHFSQAIERVTHQAICHRTRLSVFRFISLTHTKDNAIAKHRESRSYDEELHEKWRNAQASMLTAHASRYGTFGDLLRQSGGRVWHSIYANQGWEAKLKANGWKYASKVSGLYEVFNSYPLETGTPQGFLLHLNQIDKSVLPEVLETITLTGCPLGVWGPASLVPDPEWIEIVRGA